MTDDAFRQAVLRLVRRLGDDRFAAREAATQELIRLGEGVLAVVTEIDVPADPEVRHRLETVRYALVGWRDDLIERMSALGAVSESHRPEVPDMLVTILRRRQPRSGDMLLEMIERPDHPLHAHAVVAFAAGWDTMSAGQVERLLRAGLRTAVKLRPRYPQGVPAMIRMQYDLAWGYLALPADYRERRAGRALKIKTITTHYLDGEVYGKPFVYEHDTTGACTGWVRVGELARGRHMLRLVTEFSLSHRGRRIKATAKSKPYAFEVVDAGVPDDLAAERNAELDALVKRSLRFAGFDPQPKELRLGDRGAAPRPTPQVTWYTGGRKLGSLHVPTWELSEALPVDLCFEVELREVAGGRVHRAPPMVVLAGRKTGGYFCPRDVRGFAAAREGDVALNVVLKPSRATALTETEVTRYYTGTISSQPLKARIVRPTK